MDLFGSRGHDARHEETEKQLRSLAEQVAQLTIEMGQARSDLERTQARLDGKMDAPDAEAIDVDLEDAKAKLGAAKVASEEAWKELYPQLLTSLGKVREAIDAAGKPESDSADD